MSASLMGWTPPREKEREGIVLFFYFFIFLFFINFVVVKCYCLMWGERKNRKCKSRHVSHGSCTLTTKYYLPNIFVPHMCLGALTHLTIILRGASFLLATTFYNLLGFGVGSHHHTIQSNKMYNAFIIYHNFFELFMRMFNIFPRKQLSPFESYIGKVRGNLWYFEMLHW